MVSNKDESLLPDLVKEYKLLLSQVVIIICSNFIALQFMHCLSQYPETRGCCYIHHDGLKQSSFLKFRQYDGYIPLGPGAPRQSRSQEYFVLHICVSYINTYKHAATFVTLIRRLMTVSINQRVHQQKEATVI